MRLRSGATRVALAVCTTVAVCLRYFRASCPRNTLPSSVECMSPKPV